jgi:hypothetical protein
MENYQFGFLPAYIVSWVVGSGGEQHLSLQGSLCMLLVCCTTSQVLLCVTIFLLLNLQCLLILARAAAAAAAVAPILPPAAAAAALERSVNSSSCGYSGEPPCSVNCSKMRTGEELSPAVKLAAQPLIGQASFKYMLVAADIAELQGHECRRHEGTQQLAGSHNVSRSSSSSIGRLEPSGCRKGLTHVTFTPDLGLMPDLCLPLPKVGDTGVR